MHRYGSIGELTGRQLGGIAIGASGKATFAAVAALGLVGCAPPLDTCARIASATTASYWQRIAAKDPADKLASDLADQAMADATSNGLRPLNAHEKALASYLTERASGYAEAYGACRELSR